MKSPNPTRTKRSRPIDWSKVDWRMQNCEIARLTGASPNNVYLKRKELGLPRPKDWQKKSPDSPGLAQWKAVDWTKQDKAIAEALGMSRQWTRKMRKRLGAPRATHHWAQRKTLERLARIKTNWRQVKGLTKPQAEKLLGFPIHKRSPVFRFLEQKKLLALGIRMIKHPWHLMNFDLPSNVLEKIWKLPYNSASSRRYAKQLPGPIWKLEWGAAGMLRRPSPRFRAAVRAEERKAKKFYATPRPT